MIRKILLVLSTTLLIGLAILFSIPTKQKTFAEYFQGDQNVEKSLDDFRKYPMSSITQGETKWDYLSVGEGKKHLLFIHGMGGAYDIWFQQIEALKDGFHIVSITVPNVNSLSTAAGGIIAILDKEQIEKVSIIGTSMGGYIGQFFMKEFPERLDKIVLGNTFPPNQFYREQNGKMRNLVPLMPEWYVMANFRKNAEKTVFPASENSELVSAYLLEQYSGLMSKEQFIGRFDMVLEYFDAESGPVSRSIPKLIIESDNDPLVSETLRTELKEKFKEAEVFTFTGKGHFPYLNKADQYISVLKKFLAS